MNIFLEFLLPHATTLVDPDAKSAFRNENIDIRLRDLCFHDVPIFFATVIACVQNFDPVDLDDEHRCSHDMSGNIGGDLNALLFHLHSELYWTDALQAIQDLLRVEQSPIFLNFGGISDEIVIDVLGGFGHIDFFTVGIVSQEIGECTAVVEMGVGDEDHGKFFWIDVAEEGQTVGVLLVDHEAAV